MKEGWIEGYVRGLEDCFLRIKEKPELLSEKNVWKLAHRLRLPKWIREKIRL